MHISDARTRSYIWLSTQLDPYNPCKIVASVDFMHIIEDTRELYSQQLLMTEHNGKLDGSDKQKHGKWVEVVEHNNTHHTKQQRD